MWLRLKVAFRNVFRNRRRTVLNVLMISGGVSSMILFQGFAHRMVEGLRETTIRTQTGHLQVATKAYWNKTARTQGQSLIPDYSNLLKEIKETPHVRYASGRLTLFGLLTNGDKSHSAQGVSFDPAAEANRTRAFRFIKGHGLSAGMPFEIALGKGLAKRIAAKPKDRITLLANTFDGAVNAMDMEVSGIFETAIAEFDDNSFILPLSTAQTLLDTKGVEQIVVGLDHTTSTRPILASLDRGLKSSYPSLRVRPWYEVAQLYNQVASFNRVQNKAFQFIMVTLVLLSILNTVGMSIMERTGEIGTVRALGETGRSVVLQFVLEGIFLGLLGGLGGVLAGSLIAHLVNVSKVTMQLPGASSVFIVEIHLLKRSIQDGLVLAVFTAVAASLLPALRASRMNVCEALRRNFQ